MKRFFAVFVCVLLLLVTVGCKSNVALYSYESGSYYLEGDYEQYARPYFRLYPEDMGFALGNGESSSWEAHGSYEIRDGELIATINEMTMVFEIESKRTLVIKQIENDILGGYSVGEKFVFNKDRR